MYLTLYRKWRPKTFKDVLGQEETVQILKNSILLQRISHAYLFCGPRGTGKTSCARIFAKSLNCEKGPTPYPCLTCANCEQIAKGNSMDIFEIDAASNRGIENIRELRERVRLLPVQGKYKIYIIDEVHMLTGEAFNALLKTLEEPPIHVIFIMATTEPHKLPSTIISRCQRFDFRRISSSVISEKLKIEAESENIKIDDRALARIAEASEGSMRDAESMLDQLLSYTEDTLKESDVLSMLGRSNITTLRNYLECILDQSYDELFAFIQNLLIEGVDLMQFSKDLIVLVRDLFVLSKTKSQHGISLKLIPLEDAQHFLPFAQEIQENVALGMMLMWSESMQNMRYLPDPMIFFELTAIKMKKKYGRVSQHSTDKIHETSTSFPEHISRETSAPVPVSSPEWEEFLNFLKTRELVFFTTLSKGCPIYHENNQIEIILPKESKYLASRLEKTDKLKDLENLLEEFHGRKISIRLKIGTSGTASEQAEDAQKTEKKRALENPQVSESIELFSADIQYIEKKGGK